MSSKISSADFSGPLPDFLRQELESGKGLKKLWRLKNKTWLLLYYRTISGLGKPHFYLRITPHGKKSRFDFPQDFILKSLAAGIDPGKVAGCLSEYAPPLYRILDECAVNHITPRSYKPEYRCLLEYQVDLGSGTKKSLNLAGKILRSSQETSRLYTEVCFFWKSLAAKRGDIFSTHPDPFILPPLNMLVLPFVSGVRLEKLLKKEIDPGLIQKVAKGISTMHHCARVPENIFYWKDELHVLSRWISAASYIFPAFSMRLNRCF